MFTSTYLNSLSQQFTIRASSFLLSFFVSIFCNKSYAEIDWAAVTWDNDFFIGDDDGYTNGLFLSWFDLSDNAHNHDIWVSPLLWSMPSRDISSTINSYSIAQTLNTPSDISINNPSSNELPYSAILAISNHFVTVSSSVADRASVGIGLVGPLALGEEVQTYIHKAIGSEEPKGWDTQIQNEVIFILSRAKSWRSWTSESNHVDFLSNGEVNLGTLHSGVRLGFTLRYGRNLLASFPSTLFTSSRTSNPVALNGGWYLFSGIQAGYTFNQIMTDGNTYRNSRSIDYKHEFIGLSLGFAYSWQKGSLTFAISDANIIQSGRSKKPLDSLTQFGTLTFAWKI